MTHPAMSAEPGPGHTCRVCGTVLEEGSLRCPHCGATYGESNRCPHCGSVADVERNASLRYRCLVCGGPRVPLADSSIEPSGRELAALAQAQRSRVRIAAWRVAAGVVGAFGGLSLFVALLTLAFVQLGVFATVGLLIAVSVPFLLAASAWMRARRTVRERDEALDQAWTSVASDVLSATGGELDAREVGRLMRIDEAQAEQLLARLNVENLVRARVTDEGQLLYATSTDQKLRVSEHTAEAEAATTTTEQEPAGQDASRRQTERR